VDVPEFTDSDGRRWTVEWASPEIKGLVTMRQIVFRPANGDRRKERYLSVHPRFLDRVDERVLRAALSQAQELDTP
jgi:hypothetical protein